MTAPSGSSTLCTYCKAIQYETLPDEREPGIPHQPSLPDLRASAETCSLCKLLLEAVYETRGKIREHHCGGNYFPVGMISYESLDRGLKSKPMLITYNGHYAAGTRLFNGPRPGDPPNKGLGKEDIFFDNSSTMKPYLYGNWWKIDTDDQKLQLIGLGARLGSGPNIEDAEGNEELAWYCRGTQLRVRTVEGNPANAFIPGRLRTAHAGSRIALKQIKSWIERCNLAHEGCRPKNPDLPTRVLEITPVISIPSLTVSSLQTIKLVEGKGRSEAYVALSHCWGSSHNFTTTSKNLAAREEDIPFDDLPLTFQHAVLTTRRLGIRYLWIDSLCILQDVREDWEKEAPKMADVYSKSYLTLSASSSTSDSAGLWQPHVSQRIFAAQSCDQISLGRQTRGNDAPLLEENLGHPNPWKIISQRSFAWSSNYKYQGEECDILLSAEWMPTSHKMKPQIYRLGMFGCPHDPMEKQHLQSRGWTLQERVLSPRTVHFASDQMYWECCELGLGEDGVRFNHINYHIGAVLLGHTLPLGQCGAPDQGLSLIEGYKPLELSTHARWKGSWLGLVEQYTARNLTYEQDRLTAMSGLANLINRSTGDKYYAGLWWYFMAEDLCWRTYSREELRVQVSNGFRHEYGKELCKISPADNYRAPSWSWASLNGQIKFLPIDMKRLCAIPLECHTKPSTADPFGAVKEGRLKMKAPFLSVEKAASQKDFDPSLPLGFGTLSEIEFPDGISQGEVYFDYSPTYPCHALFIDSSNCIILDNFDLDGAPENQVYKRVGMGKFLRTPAQREANPVQNVGTLTPYGPMTGANIYNNLVTVDIF